MKTVGFLAAVLLLAGTAFSGHAQTTTHKAGSEITTSEVKKVGSDKFFRIRTIDSATFARIKGKSYREGCTIPVESLRYLTVLHYNMEGKIQIGELICNKAIANDLREIFRKLYDKRYPIARMVLIDEYDADDQRSMEADNTSAFNFRYVSGTRKLSNHSMGMAVDINPLQNPCVRKSDGKLTVEPEAGRKYADRSRDFVGKIDRNDLCYKLFIQHGFSWGGAWKSLKDYQHFEKRIQ